MNTSQLIRWLVPKMRLIEKDRLPAYWEEPVFSFEGACGFISVRTSAETNINLKLVIWSRKYFS